MIPIRLYQENITITSGIFKNMQLTCMPKYHSSAFR